MTDLTIQRTEPSDFQSITPFIRSSLRSLERIQQIDMLDEVLGAKPIPPNLARAFRIWQARRGPKLVGVEIGHLEAGRWASIWGPFTETSEADSTRQRLHQQTRVDLHQLGARMLQSALPLDDRDSLTTLLKLDFLPLARISALWLNLRADSVDHLSPPLTQPANPLAIVSREDRSTPDPSSPFPWRLISCDSRHEEELARVMAETYQGSLDSPLLNSLRTIEDVIAGYRDMGHIDSGLSYFIAHEDENVGYLLLGRSLDPTNWQLLYVGITPRVRGRGWGEQLVRWSAHMASTRGATSMSLEVDEANHPALGIYRRVGFERRARRQVVVQPAAAETGERAHDRSSSSREPRQNRNS